MSESPNPSFTIQNTYIELTRGSKKSEIIVYFILAPGSLVCYTLGMRNLIDLLVVVNLILLSIMVWQLKRRKH